MPEMTDNDRIESNVRVAALCLDKAAPGWYTRIVADLLWMESQTNCILGQLLGSYTSTAARALHTAISTVLPYRSTGLDPFDEHLDPEYSTDDFAQYSTHQYWLREIGARLLSSQMADIDLEDPRLHELVAGVEADQPDQSGDCA